jgi:N-acetylglucosaminyldiphosphoundecaprenol N-acetyl-beta-D-mannosaminyltransferase
MKNTNPGKVEILNTPCLIVEDVQEIKNYISSLIEQGIGGYSVAINARKIVFYNKYKKVKSVIDESLLPIPDGIAPVLGIKLLYKKKCIKLDLPKSILELANAKGYKLFILGAKEEINYKAVENLKYKYPEIKIAGRHHGYFHSDEQIINTIKTSKPHIVMVALGSPKQELFENRISKELKETLFIGCGGALDILSGKIKRAPAFIANNGLEFIYRFFQSPKKIIRFIKMFWLFNKLLTIHLFKILLKKYITKKK